MIRVIPIWLALVLTVGLLVLVGIGEARQNYHRFRLDTTAVQSESMLSILRPDLENGTALNSISGLSTMARNLADSDPALTNIAFFAENGDPLNSTNPAAAETLKRETFISSKIPFRDETYQISESDRYVRVSKAIQTRFGQAGSVDLVLDKNFFRKQTGENFEIMLLAAAVAAILLYIVIVASAMRNAQRPQQLKRAIQISYFLLFLGCAGVIIHQTLKIYTSAVEYKSQALGNFLARRLSMASGAGIDFKDLSGVNELLTEFKREHREICAVDLLVNGSALYAADAKPDVAAPSVVTSMADADVFAYTAPLSMRSKNGSEDLTLHLRVKVPKSVIREAVMNGAVNLLVLLFACSLLANLILEIGITRLSHKLLSQGRDLLPSSEDALASMQTAYLVMGLINALTLPFLAPLIKDINGGNVSSLPFTTFFLCFALFMIPAGKLAEKGYTRHLLVFGALAEIAGCLLVAVGPSMGMLTAGRSFSGLGQGLFLIGFQSFIISVTTKHERTQGQALKVIIRYAVLMAGSAIGALMYVFLDYALVFWISAALGLFTLLHILFVLPDPNRIAHSEPVDADAASQPQEAAACACAGAPAPAAELQQQQPARNASFWRIFIDREFLIALLLNGIPSKIAVAGVIMFSIPLLMKDVGVSGEAVGRYLMLYYVTCMFVSRWSAKVADASGHTRGMLTWGAVLGGVSFALLGGLTGGVINIPGIENWMVVLLAVSVFLGGASNGLTAAPILTHIGKSEAAKTQGQKTMVAVYSFAERMGHVAGPALMVYCATLAGNMGLAILWFGLISLALGAIFRFASRNA